MKVKSFLRILLCLGIFLIFHNIGYAGTQRLNSIDYKVQLKPDGSMDVVETWDIYIDETNTLFKDFVLDPRKYQSITNIKVKNLDTQKDLTKIYKEMYHVTKDCYYGLPVSKDKFEIAWGVGLDDSSDTRKYEISYTVEDVICVYLDGSELYWQFIGNTNGMKAKKVTGTIRLPQAMENLEKLRVWAHGPLNGEIYKTSKDTITFSVDNLAPKTMVETRIVVEEPMFTQSLNHIPQNKLPQILAEEEKWAEEANQERNKNRVMLAIFTILDLVLIVFFGKKILRYRKELKKVKQEQFSIDIGKYFRDIPREKEATPAEAAFLYYLNLSGVESSVISATLLQLCLKRYISFDKDGKDIRIHLLKPADESLKESEKIVYEIITESLANSSNSSVTMEEIQKYAKCHYNDFQASMENLKQQAKSFHEDYGNYDRKMEKKRAQYSAKLMGYIIGIVLLFFGFILDISENGVNFLFVFALPVLIEWGISIILLSKTQKSINLLTEQGETERQQWKGLKKYMEDFSLLKEREIPDLVLWEKYLVYATAFGISEKVIQQLKIVYPQMQDLDNNTYTYLYLMSSNRFSGGFIQELNKSTNRTYNAYKNAYSTAHSVNSSGFGGGGGFSSGGGGRWWRWPEWAEDRLKNGEIYENRNRYWGQSYWNRAGRWRKIISQFGEKFPSRKSKKYGGNHFKLDSTNGQYATRRK